MIFESKQISVKKFRNLEYDENDRDFYELIDGIVFRKATPNPLHQSISMNLCLQLGDYLQKEKLGELFASPIDVFLDDFNAFQPDLVFISTENQHFITDDGIIGIPDLIIEIISPSSVLRDRIDKKNVCERLKVKEYWIIDPQNQEIEIYSVQNDRYELLSGVTMFEGELKSNILEGISINLTELFE
jgi:Uma2 family endonuclease